MFMEILNWFSTGDLLFLGMIYFKCTLFFSYCRPFSEGKRDIHHFKDDWFKYTYFQTVDLQVLGWLVEMCLFSIGYSFAWHDFSRYTTLSCPGRSDIGGQFFNQSLGLFEHPDPGKVVPWFARGVLRVEGQGESWGVGNRLFIKSIEHLSNPNTWQYMNTGLKRNIIWTSGHIEANRSQMLMCKNWEFPGDSRSIQTC